MTAHLPPAVPARRGPTARWTTTLVALALLTGCAPSTTADRAPSAGQSTADSPSATIEPTAETTPSPSETPVPAINPPSDALSALKDLKVAASGTMSDYDRDTQFGEWIDADADCQDTRQEILNRDLEEIVSADGCAVNSGVLNPDPYTDTIIDFTRGVATSSEVQIDHVVAAGNAWISGARHLSQDRRVEFYNDPLNLLAVDGPTNGAKSDAAAHEWLPPNTDFHCQYVATQIAVKAKYELWVTAPEKTAMTNVLTDCEGQELPTGEPFTDLTASSGTGVDVVKPVQEAPEPEPVVPAPAPVVEAPAPVAPAPAPAAPAGPVGGFANCSAAKAAGAAPLYAGSPGYAPKLDRDGDGVACES